MMMMCPIAATRVVSGASRAFSKTMTAVEILFAIAEIIWVQVVLARQVPALTIVQSTQRLQLTPPRGWADVFEIS